MADDLVLTPLEKAARALYRLHDAPSQELLDRLKSEGREDDLAEEIAEEDQVWPRYVDDVRAVLAAIREPSEGMVEAGGEQVSDAEFGPGHYEAIADGRFGRNMANDQATKAWQAMIDTALKEG